ncbi:MAG: hypothetical protein M3Q30_09485 [Actinomycetota bacterium]|nr:hypothetical protein [Actinomycetota bacterium]
MFLVSLRQFLDHGSLYRHTWSGYGPFYYSFVGLIYRLTGQAPTLQNGRLLALAFTAVSASVFAAAVWRVTKSLPASVLCEVGAFVILILSVSPMHPALLIVLILAVLTYALSSYAVEPRHLTLLVAGGAVGAVTMTKVNVGLFAGVGMAVAFVVGNRNQPPLIRALVAGSAVLLPFVLIFQSFSETWAAVLAGMVSVSLLALVAVMTLDAVSLPRRAIVVATLGAVVTAATSVCWPLLTGTSLPALFEGVVTKPLRQVDLLTIPATVRVNWVVIVLTLSVLLLAVTRPDARSSTWLAYFRWPHAALAVAGLWLFGLGTLDRATNFASWLPAIVVLPALAFVADAGPSVRLALRFLLPLAVLQVLHAYPVAGAQVGWATVAMTVPCTIAIAAGLERHASWREMNALPAALATGSLCLLLVLAAGSWPPALWKTYTAQPVLGLRGATFIRVDAERARVLRTVTAALREQCDTFYSAPGLNSFYIFSGLPPPTGLLANWPGVLDVAQQKEVLSRLRAAERANERVCILRDVSRTSAWLAGYGSGPLRAILTDYDAVIARAGPYAISVRP